MIPYYQAPVYIGPNGEQVSMGYHPGPMPPFDQAPPLQHPHLRQQQQQQQHPHQQQHHHHPQHHQPQHPHPQHPHSHGQPHLPRGTGGSLAPIHGPTSAPLSIAETSGKTLKGTHPATRLESISTPDMLQLESSPSLDSADSGFTGTTELKAENKTNTAGRVEPSQDEERIKGYQQSADSLRKGNSTGSQIPSSASSSPKNPTSNNNSSTLNEAHRQLQERPKRTGPQQPTSHYPADTLDTTESDSVEGVLILPASVGVETGLRGGAEEVQGPETATTSTSPTGDPSESSGTGAETTQRNHNQQEPGPAEPAQQERHSETQNSKGGSQPIPPGSSLSDTYSGQPQPPFSPHQHGQHQLQNHQQGYQQPQARSSSASSYYGPRHNHPHPKPFAGPQGQGPGGPHTPANLAPGPHGLHGYGMPLPFYSPNNPSMPSPTSSRRAIGFHPQSSGPAGSHPMGSPRLAGPQYHSSAGFKPPPFLNPGLYPPEYSGYYHGPEGWRGHPAPTLQKKPKELDKAMWVGNVLNDTTIAELQAIFEAEPTEAEGDIQHDVPESIFILAKSNCAFVNYSSHEAVDRAVLRFHDREFKNTRLVCRPRKDPATDSSSQSAKSPAPGRFQSQMQHPSGESSYLSPPGRYYDNEPQGADQSRRYDAADTQASMERIRLADKIPLSNSPSSEGEGGGSQLKEKDRSSKKSRSSSSLGFTESRYFILKSLNEEDLKLSVQYGLWATQDHLVPILNDAFENTRNVYLVFSANKSGEFFGYARMTSAISSDNTNTMSLDANDAWKPSIEIPLSPEMRASLVEEYEQATKEGRQLTNEQAEIIAKGSTTTTSWGILFTVEWIHVHKVPFTRTAHLLNPLYENREVKVSKDGTEVETSVGEQLLGLFKNSNRGRRDGGDSASTVGSQSNSETGSRRSSVTGDNPTTPSASTLAPPSHLPHQTPRSTSSRRSSVMSSRSVGSNSARDRRTSVDPSSSSSHKSSYSGQNHKSGGGPHPSQYNNHQRGPYGGDGQHHHQYQTHSPAGGGGYRSGQRQGGQFGYSGYDQSSTYTSQGPQHPSGQHGEHQRQGWKSNYKSGPSASGSYGGSPNPGTEYGSPRGQMSGHYQDHRKGGGGGKYNNNYYSSGPGTGYDLPSQQPYYPSGHGQRRPPPGQGGPHHQHQGHSASHSRPNMSPPAVESNGNGNGQGYKASSYHDYNYSGPRSGPSPPSITHSSPISGAGAGGPPPMSQQPGPPPAGFPGAAGGPPLPFHVPPPPGYPIPGAYMGYNPYAHPGPGMMMHHPGAMVWHHPSQGPLMSPGMIPAPIPGSGANATGVAATTIGAAGNAGGTSNASQSSTSESKAGGASGGGEPEIGVTMEGGVPYFDGIAYGYIPPEEAYQQSMYGYGYMPAPEGGLETEGGSQGEHGDPNNPLGHPGYIHYPQHPGAYPHPMYHHPYQQYPAPYYGQPPHHHPLPHVAGSHPQQSQGPPALPPAAHLPGHQQHQPMGPGGPRPSRSDSSSTRSSTSTLIPATTTNSGQAPGSVTGGGTGPQSDNKTKDADDVIDVVIGDTPDEDEPDVTETDTDVLPENLDDETEGQPMEGKSMANPASGGAALEERRSMSEPTGSVSTKDSASRSRPKAKSTTK